MYTELLNRVDNHSLQYCNGLMLREYQFLNDKHFQHFYL